MRCFEISGGASGSNSPVKKQSAGYIASGVALMTFVVYLASLQNDFVEWDDSQYVFDNLRIRSFDLAFFKWAFFDFYAGNWHPLTWISHALDYAVWGLNPMGHHLTNNILHAVNTFIAVLLVARLIEAAKPFTIHYSSASVATGDSPRRADPPGAGDSPSALVAAASTGLLFGLHPIHVESVAWVAERKDLLCALFYLLSVMAYMSYRSHKTYRTYFLTLAFFVLALMSKPMAVSLPVVLLILDWYPFKRITSLDTFGKCLIGKIPFIALSILSSILTILAQRASESVVAMEAIPLSTRMLVAAKSLIAYLWKMVVPMHLIPYYPYPKDVSLFSVEYLSAVVLIVAITAACVVVVKKQKLFLSVWACYVATLVPVLGLVQVGGQSMADRYTYLASLGPFLMIGMLAALFAERLGPKKPGWRLFGTAVAIVASLALSGLTYGQIRIWGNSFTLWTHVIEKEPDRVPIAYNNRGLAFYGKGQFDRSIEDFNKAIILDPSSFKAYLNRGAAFVNKGQFAQAAADFDKAIELHPSYSEAYNAKGSLFGLAGYLDKAIEQFGKAIETKPDYSAAYGNRGTIYSLIGQNDKALEDLDRAIQLDRYYAENYLNRGNVHMKTGNRELAVSDFQRACDLGNRSGCDSLHAVRMDQWKR
jgi:Tfp pilus assembly protein PilF